MISEDQLVYRALDHAQEGSEGRLFAVRGDRHIRCDDAELDIEMLVLRSLGDGVRETAAEGIDVALVASGVVIASDRCAVDEDGEVRISRPPCPGFDNEGNIGRADLGVAEHTGIGRCRLVTEACRNG